jgi:hypothetical protein
MATAQPTIAVIIRIDCNISVPSALSAGTPVGAA